MKNTILLSLLTLLLACADGLAQRPQVAVLLFDGVEIIDFSAPYEVFGQAGFRVFTVAEEKRAIVTAMNLNVLPDYSLSEAPRANVLVIPGGRVPHVLPRSDPKIQWLLAHADSAQWVLSVCNGAFVPASAGLLDGRRATTTAGMVDHLTMASANLIPVGDKRFVADGKFVTSGGLSAGLDGALYVVSQMLGEGRAREIANNMEYHWDPSGKWVRGKLADIHLTRVMDFNPPLGRRNVLLYEGDENQWQSRYQVKRKEPLSEFYKQFTDMAAGLNQTNWELKKKDLAADRIASTWTVTTPDGARWACEALFQKMAGEGEVEFGFSIKKVGSR